MVKEATGYVIHEIHEMARDPITLKNITAKTLESLIDLNYRLGIEGYNIAESLHLNPVDGSYWIDKIIASAEIVLAAAVLGYVGHRIGKRAIRTNETVFKKYYQLIYKMNFSENTKEKKRFDKFYKKMELLFSYAQNDDQKQSIRNVIANSVVNSKTPYDTLNAITKGLQHSTINKIEGVAKGLIPDYKVYF